MSETTPILSIKKYKFEDKNFYQQRMVAGQKMAVVNVLADIIGKNPLGFKAIFEGGASGINITDTLDSIIKTLSSAEMHRLVGIIILHDGEKASELADVVDFEQRGKDILFSVNEGFEYEVLADFFELNRDTRDPIVSTVIKVGLALQSQIGSLTEGLHESLTAALNSLQSSSATVGENHPKTLSGPTPSES